MSEAEKTCPDCAETIKAAALVCRYCAYRFPGPSDRESGSLPPPVIAELPPSPPRSSGSRRQRVRFTAAGAGVVVLAAAAVLVWQMTAEGKLGAAEPQEVVRQYTTAMTTGKLRRGCALMTGTGADEIASASVEYLRMEAQNTPEYRELLTEQLKDLGRDNVCESSGGTLLDPQFRVERSMTDELDADGTSDVQDVDIEAEGDEATVNTKEGVWVLHELGGHWFVSSVPLWKELVDESEA